MHKTGCCNRAVREGSGRSAFSRWLRRNIVKSQPGSATDVISSEKGVALVMVLILSGISLALMAGLLYMLASGTQISGMKKRYKSALEAGKGSADFAFQLIDAGEDPSIPTWSYSIPAEDVNGTDCLTEKLTTASKDTWDPDCDSSLLIDPSADPSTTNSYDFYTELGGGALTYRAYGKIVHTIEGAVGEDAGLTKGGVTEGESSGGKHPHWLYTIEIDSQNVNIPAERAKLSILYEY